MRIVVASLALAVAIEVAAHATGYTPSGTVILHGHPQHLHLYGPDNGRPVIVASGDGGWMHVAPHLAEYLANRGWRVTGLDARSYLSGAEPLDTTQVQRDFQTLIGVSGDSSSRTLLIGVSEGAGLSLLAATDRDVRNRISGVVTVGLAESNELAWHWRDSIIYLTKGVPNEPIFHASDVISHVAPAPLALIWSTHDEFVPAPDRQRLAALARVPARVWTVEASDHRFSDNTSALDANVMDAIAWISR